MDTGANAWVDAFRVPHDVFHDWRAVVGHIFGTRYSAQHRMQQILKEGFSEVQIPARLGMTV